MALTATCNSVHHSSKGPAIQNQIRKPYVGYRFFVPDKEDCLKPFTSTTDRRLLRIMNITECTIHISQTITLHRGQYMRKVLITGSTRTNVTNCVHQIEESFPQFYALAPLQRSLDELKQPKLSDIKRCVTMENVTDTGPVEVTYYKLHFFISAGCQKAYEHWRKGRVARIIEKMDCHLVVSQRDHPDVGFIRRYAVILGSKRQNVMQAYKLFSASFIDRFT
ncbi:hypothetical protein PHET_08343 [Paragonimus heterotremus]|uniref:Uncharacterized protein n=1 Tax=Paragonimus heterotremus TaxID=100268 RepID=A0A8J4WFZ0_9TREM|nr:hypothetical protein PHET_08343 [Paragonimus heterotremus]